ncbi:MAG: hypothetical protein ACK4V2_00005 [Pseudomonadota bacterium]
MKHEASNLYLQFGDSFGNNSLKLTDKLNELAAELKSENSIDVITVAKDLSETAAAEFLFDFCLKNNIQINSHNVKYQALLAF